MTSEPLRLGAYQILDLLGRGGMGEVHRAKDTKLDRFVAVKVLTPALASDPSALARFEREAKAVAALHHPNILGIFDFGVHEGRPFAVMELLEGQNLRQVLAKRPLSPRQALEIARQVARGLAAAHEKKFIHRDLKPENVFLCKDGLVKLLDFGLAKSLAILARTQETGAHDVGSGETFRTEKGLLLGTIGYLSPEQVRGEEGDYRSDIFSFGILLFEMLTGLRPFERPSAAETLSAILKEDPSDPSASGVRLPPGVKGVLDHCLAKDPERRFQSMQDVGFALEALSSESTASGFGRVRLPQGPVKWKPWAATLGIFLSALLLVSLGTFLPSRGSANPHFQRLTFRRGGLLGARFAPDGQSVVYASAWEREPLQVYVHRPDGSDEPLGPSGAVLFAVSREGELAYGLETQRTLHADVEALLGQGRLGNPAAPRGTLPMVHAADWGPEGLLTVRREGQRFVMEYPQGKVRLETSSLLTHPRVSPDGKKVAFVEHPDPRNSGGRVALLDLATGETRSLTGSFVEALGVAWKGKEVWFTAIERGAAKVLLAVTPAGKQRLVLRCPGSLYLHDIARDGRVLLAQDDLRSGLLRMGPEGDQDLSWQFWSVPRDLSGDGHHVLFDEQGSEPGPDFPLYLRATEGKAPVLLGRAGVGAAFSPDGASVAYFQRTPQASLVVAPTLSGIPRTLPLGGLRPESRPSFSADGRAIYFAARVEDGHLAIHRMDLATGTHASVGPPGIGLPYSSARALSPGDRHLLVRDRGPALLELSAPDRPPLPILGLAEGEVVAGWVPDQPQLLVFRPGPFPLVLEALDPFKGTRRPWRTFAPPTHQGLRANAPFLSGDGHIALFRYYQESTVLFVVEGLE